MISRIIPIKSSSNTGTRSTDINPDNLEEQKIKIKLIYPSILEEIYFELINVLT